MDVCVCVCTSAALKAEHELRTFDYSTGNATLDAQTTQTVHHRM
jgi:hypothetical protein